MIIFLLKPYEVSGTPSHSRYPNPLAQVQGFKIIAILIVIFAQLRKIRLLYSDDVTATSHREELAFLGSNALLKLTQISVL